MLNKPKFMIPSTNMQECTIDVNSDQILFSCIVDGNEAIYAWRIKIYPLDSNTEVYNTGKITTSNKTPALPFFPINEKNQNVVFKVNLKDYPSTSGTGLVNTKEPYRWTIEFWNSNTSIDKATTTSCEEVFYANATPNPVLYYKSNGDSEYSQFPSGEKVILKANDYSFKASYEQSESVPPLKRYGWRITDKDSGQILLDTITHNQVYGTFDNIICSYSGFLNDSNYSIELYIETQNNSSVLTPPILFSVAYPTTFLSNDFRTEALKNEPAIMLNWEESTIIGGKEVGGKVYFENNYPIVKFTETVDDEGNLITKPSGSNSVVIPNGVSLVYDYGSNSNLDISEDCYIVLSTQLPNSDRVVIFSAEGIGDNGYGIARSLIFENGEFVYTVISSDDTTISKRVKILNQADMPSNYVWYVIIMSPYLGEDGIDTFLTVNISHAINGEYPSDNLYPSDTLYPSFGVWDKLKN